MPLTGRWTRLASWAINAVPKAPGVYELASVQFQTIFFGSSDNLDLRLRQHLYVRGPCLSRAWHFRYEEHAAPQERLKELLDEYQREHDRPPDCQR